MKTDKVVKFLHNRFAAVILGAIACLFIYISYALGNVFPITSSKGFGLPSPSDWLPHGVISLSLNIAICIGISLHMIILNKRFNLMHSTSVLFAGLFMLMQAAMPSVGAQFYDGTLLCAVVVLCLGILFTCFNDYSATRPIFLIFFILALCALTQYAFILFMPAFLIGCAQMRILSTRTLTAAIIGMVTPIWILTGFGILNLNDFSLPEFSNIFSALRDRTLLHMTIATGTTIILCAIAGIGCMLRTYNYNTTGRSFNGVIYILSITSIVLVIVDYTNISTYIPLLNCCTAYHVAHFFASHSRRHSYIGIITVLALYIGLYIWSALL